MQAVKLIGNSPLLVNYGYSCSFFNINSVFAQSLRWRKPFWLPTAKSKVFRVPKRPQIPEDELKEIRRIYNNYRTCMKSIRNYFAERVASKEVAQDPVLIEKVEAEDFAKCSEINAAWNQEIALMREERLRKEKEIRDLQILQAIENKKLRDAEIIQSVEKKVRQAKIEVKTFVTQDNIDQAIEEALDNVTDYSKALDIDGTWYTEKSGLPPSLIPKIEQVQINH
ncbi:small ribosomal subunit protein mS26 [Phymastichus coffea]|uniref:small ribosomal subunit protein mS26 n=1 Tax=Phymastichus coffea TaxID=108790 RepID=UPI00273C2018|nr:small ribosomal subunit protein mS26 [Phymastichus coffea]